MFSRFDASENKRGLARRKQQTELRRMRSRTVYRRGRRIRRSGSGSIPDDIDSIAARHREHSSSSRRLVSSC